MTVDAVIVASYSTPELRQMTEDCITSLHQSENEHAFNVLVENDDKDFNYNKLLCRGIKRGDGDWIILANNDLLFHKNFFTHIHAAYKNKIAESFGCWNPKYHEKYFKQQQPYYYGYRTSLEMTGWLLVTTRNVLERINFCEKNNQRVTFFYSDNIFADLLQKHNIKHALVRNSKVTHLQGQTLKTKSKDEQKELTKNQKSKYLCI